MPDRISIPCRSCGNTACELELPPLEAEKLAPLWPVIRLAAWKALAIELPKESPTGNPLASIEPAAIAEILAVNCAVCARVSFPPIQLANVG